MSAIGRIAIVEDDEDVRASMRALLESHGYEVRDHASAEAFLSLSEQGLDCVLTDHHMPGMTGIEMLVHMRATGDQTPALIITGRTEPHIRAQAGRIGVKVLLKPVDDEELVLSIEQARSI